MQKYPKNNSIERSIYNKKAFAAMNFPIFFAYRTKKHILKYTRCFCLFTSPLSNNSVDICVMHMGVNCTSSLRE